MFEEMKLFFNERFLDGKSLFRVLQKQTFQNDKNDGKLQQEIAWKLLELIFLIDFLQKDENDSEIFKIGLDFGGSEIGRVKTNPLVTKCII